MRRIFGLQQGIFWGRSSATAQKSNADGGQKGKHNAGSYRKPIPKWALGLFPSLIEVYYEICELPTRRHEYTHDLPHKKGGYRENHTVGAGCGVDLL